MGPMKTKPATPHQSAANCWIHSEMPASGGGATVTSGLSARGGDGFSRRPAGLDAQAVQLLRMAPPGAGERAQGILDLLDVDMQPLGELGREPVARLRRHGLERGVELGGRHAERRRELLADVAASVAPVAARAAIGPQVAERRAHLRGVDAGGRRDVVDQRVAERAAVAVPSVAIAVAAVGPQVLARLVEAGLDLRAVDAERLRERG